MIKIPGYVDYIIISSCNLNCSNCDRFSNYNLPHMISPEDFEKDIKSWREKVEFSCLTLQGGEPTMHPKLCELLKIARKYTKGDVTTFTNGTLLHKKSNQNLIETLFEVQPSDIFVSIHLSSEEEKKLIFSNIKKYLLKDYNWKKIKEKTLRCEQVTITIDDYTNEDNFWMPYNNIDNGIVKPYKDSNPELSYERCGAKNCSSIYKGKIYKCPRSALLRDFLDKYNLHNDPDWKKYYDYRGVDKTGDLQKFVNNKTISEDICGMCPAYELAKPQTGVTFK